ncbi:MAG: ion transporter [Bdellovibrionota bacterium]
MTKWRARLHEIIFEADTPEGKAFDVSLIWLIVCSVILVTLDSVESINAVYGRELYIAEWCFTIIFSIEYILRMLAVNKPHKYVFSFFGAVDLLSILPTYLSFFFPGAQALQAIRVFRLLRIFRIFKLGIYLGEADLLSNALRASRHKITVFLAFILATVITVGSLMYVIEGPSNGFTSIPVSIYWAIVTMTTVGYGDIAPKTPIGQILASVVMIAGYAIIAIPTGIVTSEIARASSHKVSTQTCPSCSLQDHDIDAKFCKACGHHL